MLNVVLLLLIPLAICLENGLGRTPPMGWNSWNKFKCHINEDLIRKTADRIVSLGLDKLGYKYVNLDDCWQLTRNSTTNRIQPDPITFPSGMKALGDYIHSKGLKYGVYTSAGTMTCEKRPGGLYYEEIDAKDYAEWGVDYLKYDNCFNVGVPAVKRYTDMRDALNKTGRPIYFSMCEWGENRPWEWAQPVGNSWRTTGDIMDSYNSFLGILNSNVGIAHLGQPGGWNDMDMLEVGNGGMTTTEYESHFALWALLKSPLIIGCDLNTITNDTLKILSNYEIIAVNQDPLGIPATRLSANIDEQIWGGPVVGGKVALLFNLQLIPRIMTLDFNLLKLEGEHFVRDLSLHQNVGFFTDKFKAIVQPHGVIVVKIVPKSFHD